MFNVGTLDTVIFLEMTNSSLILPSIQYDFSFVPEANTIISDPSSESFFVRLMILTAFFCTIERL